VQTEPFAATPALGSHTGRSTEVRTEAGEHLVDSARSERSEVQTEPRTARQASDFSRAGSHSMEAQAQTELPTASQALGIAWASSRSIEAVDASMDRCQPVHSRQGQRRSPPRRSELGSPGSSSGPLPHPGCTVSSSGLGPVVEPFGSVSLGPRSRASAAERTPRPSAVRRSLSWGQPIASVLSWQAEEDSPPKGSPPKDSPPKDRLARRSFSPSNSPPDVDVDSEPASKELSESEEMQRLNQQLRAALSRGLQHLRRRASSRRQRGSHGSLTCNRSSSIRARCLTSCSGCARKFQFLI
ncbi:unnamed protein product, partial [Polarella glacialis]